MNQGKSMPRNTKASAIVTPTAAAIAAETIKKLKATVPAVANATAVPALPKATTPAQAHALETLADFYKSVEFTKDSPVLHVYSAEKATFLRGFLKVARLRAEAQGKKFTFITIKSPADPKSAGDPKKAVSGGPKPPAPNLP